MASPSQGPVLFLLFVYGTLKKGKPLHDLLEGGSHFLGNVSATGFALFTNNGFYPFLSPHLGGQVLGELYAVEPEVLENCRQVELGAGYSEVILEVTNRFGSTVPAYAYLGSRDWRLSAAYVGEEWEGW